VERNKIVLPVVGALLAAIIGGGIWATLTVITEYEFGLLALGIGGLVGYTVVLFSKGQTTQIHQVIAVIASLIGILLGKYFIFSYIEVGFERMFSIETISYFKDNLMEYFNGIDLVFIVLAAVTAWRLSSQASVQQKESQPQGPSV